VATQMYKTHHYVPCYDDKILEAKRYIEADELEKHADLEAKVGIIYNLYSQLSCFPLNPFKNFHIHDLDSVFVSL
jgi:hypothetical protein